MGLALRDLTAIKITLRPSAPVVCIKLLIVATMGG
jgi:hypothetical protein